MQLGRAPIAHAHEAGRHTHDMQGKMVESGSTPAADDDSLAKRRELETELRQAGLEHLLNSCLREKVRYKGVCGSTREYGCLLYVYQMGGEALASILICIRVRPASCE